MIDNYRKFTLELEKLEAAKRVEAPKFSYRMMFGSIPQPNGKRYLSFRPSIDPVHQAEIKEAFMKHYPDAVIL